MRKNIYYMLIGFLLIFTIIYVESGLISDSMNSQKINYQIEYNDGHLTINLDEIYVEGEYMELYVESNTTNQSPENYDAHTIKISEGDSVKIANFDCEEDRVYAFVNDSQIFSYSVDSTSC